VNIAEIRLYGDPVLNSKAADVTEIDGRIASLAETMIETMYEAPGVGLAANQIGVQRRVFVYDIGDGPVTIINPQIIESDGEWTYEEGCLSVPGLSWEITRPNQIHLVGFDLDGNEISIETDEFEGRVFQHELDHLDGVLLLERLDDDQRREAKKILRERSLEIAQSGDPDGLGRLRFARRGGSHPRCLGRSRSRGGLCRHPT
jgi:peptide deformylase